MHAVASPSVSSCRRRLLGKEELKELVKVIDEHIQCQPDSSSPMSDAFSRNDGYENKYLVGVHLESPLRKCVMRLQVCYFFLTRSKKCIS